MLSSEDDDSRYVLLEDPENENHETDSNTVREKPTSARWRSRWSLILRRIAIPAFILLVSVFSVTVVVLSVSAPKRCQHPRIRREWRTFNKAEKQAYIDAAVCLTRTQSPIDPRVTIHDDFAYLHSRIGNYCRSFPTARGQ